jgi:hypothetical protein
VRFLKRRRKRENKKKEITFFPPGLPSFERRGRWWRRIDREG